MPMSMNAAEPGGPLQGNKRHFKALDGLRGVAAIAVVTFHFMEMVIYDYSKLFIGHGFLAVDFFFCLSGFVIGYAYDDRVGTIGVWEFLRARLIRLHPMVAFGAVIGLIALLLDPFAGPLAYKGGKVFLMFLASALLIPYPVMRERGFSLFCLNAPSWSLFWEYIANIFYGIVVYKLMRRWLIFFTVIAGAGLCFAGYRAGALSGGWNGETLWVGGARVAYSFLAGLLVYRSRWIIRSRVGFGALSVLLLLALMMPYATGAWIREALVVLFYFPLLIALGAGAVLTPFSEKLCTLAGNISYPLYMTHYAVIWIFGNYYSTYKPSAGRLALIVPCGVLLMVGFSYSVMVLYDMPVRKYLARSLRFRRQLDTR